MRRRWITALIAVVLLSGLAIPVVGQEGRSLVWERWDVRIDNVDTAANRFDVTESYTITFDGTFRFGSAVIPLNRLENIRNIEVREAGVPLVNNCSQQTGTYCVRRAGGEVALQYVFGQPITDASQTFEITYTVDGALRVYEGGDQLWWDAIPEEHFGFPILSSTITVMLPDGFGPREGIDPIETFGAPTTIQVNGETVVIEATAGVGPNEMLSVRVQYPHDPDARMAAWQSDFDAQRAFEENVLPIITVVVLLVSLLITVGGPLLAFTLWRTRGTDPQIGPVPEHLSAPPSDLPPAVAGSLVDERADVRDVMSTALDLGNRGYLVIEETQSPAVFGLSTNRDYTFKRTDKPLDDLRSFERRFVDNVFSGARMERTFASLREQFYAVIPHIQRDLYREMVHDDFFNASPQTTRAFWQGVGMTLFAAAFGLIFLIIFLEWDFTPAIFCLPMAIGVASIAMLIAAPNMPAKTRKGAEEAAKWRAFMAYLRNLTAYDDVESAASRFDQYLPYAVAFGLEKTWVRQFEGTRNVSIPPWYFPTHLGPYRGGYTPGTPLSRSGGAGEGGGLGELARAGGEGGFSLDDMSGDLTSGLTSISEGLTG
ncbi:MAG: DUF2207 domain-containing protein, partial [Chloroflexi bacterium]|nr:DUF2207 domain-containing protein [Chloroflexota bacterium]